MTGSVGVELLKQQIKVIQCWSSHSDDQIFERDVTCFMFYLYHLTVGSFVISLMIHFLILGNYFRIACHISKGHTFWYAICESLVDIYEAIIDVNRLAKWEASLIYHVRNSFMQLPIPAVVHLTGTSQSKNWTLWIRLNSTLIIIGGVGQRSTIYLMTLHCRPYELLQSCFGLFK